MPILTKIWQKYITAKLDVIEFYCHKIPLNKLLIKTNIFIWRLKTLKKVAISIYAHFWWSLIKRSHVMITYNLFWAKIFFGGQWDLRFRNSTFINWFVIQNVFNCHILVPILVPIEITCKRFLNSWSTDYGRPMKPFFIKIQNFRAWPDKLGR